MEEDFKIPTSEDVNRLKNQKEVENFLYRAKISLIFSLVITPICFLFYSLLIMKYWEWFAVPLAKDIFKFTLPILSYGQSVAISIFCCVLMEYITTDIKAEAERQEKGKFYMDLMLFFPIVYTITFLLFGWFAQWIIFQ